eukprot:symbB.v1.2.022161.t1/scaffold1954.1/size95041/4
MVLRRTPRCILERCGESVAPRAGGVFVQSTLAGSPAETRSIHPHCFLMEMNGKPVHSLSDVLTFGQSDKKMSEKRAPYVRLLLLDMNGQEHVKAIQPDLLFFPTMNLQRSSLGHWSCAQKN